MVTAALPDLDQLDIEALKILVVEQRESLDSHTQQVEHLKLVIEKLRRMIFGAKSEKVIVQVEQFELQLEEAETEQASAEEKLQEPVAVTKPLPKARPSRKPLPAHLPREVVTHHPDQNCCPDCGGQLRNFGEDVAEILEYIPANFKPGSPRTGFRPWGGRSFATCGRSSPASSASALSKLPRHRAPSSADLLGRDCWRMCW